MEDLDENFEFKDLTARFADTIKSVELIKNCCMDLSDEYNPESSEDKDGFKLRKETYPKNLSAS